jgi:pimeloyl-ACP methyl ester carboxylesterase
MPYATNPLDGARSYFEDWGGGGAPVLVYAGLGDPIESAQETGLARDLREHYRLIFVDHRGHGHSDTPHTVAAYALSTRVADAVAVLDQLGIVRAHVLGLSWGARLGFALGEYAPERVLSLVLVGNQPYAWDERWAFVPALTRAFEQGHAGGMREAVRAIETSIDEEMAEPGRTRMLAADPVALHAAWQSALREGPISADLRRWELPVLVCVADGEDMQSNAQRAAAEIPGGELLVLDGHTHLSAPDDVEQLVPAVRAFLDAQATR